MEIKTVTTTLWVVPIEYIFSLEDILYRKKNR